MKSQKLRHILLSAGAIVLALFFGGSAQASVVTDWNAAVTDSLAVPAERGPRVPFRALALMHLSMFEAVNAIDHKYASYVITEIAPPGARAEAAAIQAAYTVISTLLPAHQAAYDAQLMASLAALPGNEGNSQSIARGRQWGEWVAKTILAARSTDGATTVLPPFMGLTTAGYWRHAPLGASPTAGYANLVTKPFTTLDPMTFDPGPPYGLADRAAALASPAYAADVNEIQLKGGLVSNVRTAQELDEALYLDACDIAGLNGILRSKVESNARLVDTAREFALLNMTAFDATVVFFRLKYHHALWRPFQAINFADEDNNAATLKDVTWVSRIPTPPHPEYISAHVTLFTSMLHVIARLEGDAKSVDFTATASAAYPGGTKTFASLAAISDAAVNARINVGYHFRSTGEISQVIGREIGDYVVDHTLMPLTQP